MYATLFSVDTKSHTSRYRGNKLHVSMHANVYCDLWVVLS